MDKVIVGIPDLCQEGILEERLALESALQGEGVEVVRAPFLWPRNCFVNDQRTILSARDHGDYADGGCVLSTPEFVIASSEVSMRTNDSSDTRWEKLSGLYGQKEVHILAPPRKSEGSESFSPDIDLVVLPVPHQKSLFVDKHYYCLESRALQYIADKHSYKLKTIADNYRGVREWPCNSLLVRGADDCIMVTNACQGDSPLRSVSGGSGIRLIEFPFTCNSRQNKFASIGCATNVVPSEYQNPECLIFDSVVHT